MAMKEIPWLRNKIAQWRSKMAEGRGDDTAVWSFRSVFGFCVSGIAVDTDKEQTL
jgi:hypothetical protein